MTVTVKMSTIIVLRQERNERWMLFVRRAVAFFMQNVILYGFVNIHAKIGVLEY
jgi:hypothetical protein